MKYSLMVFACVGYFALPAFAQNSRPKGPAGLEAALEACKSQGKPGDSAFESCMTSKGFKKPSGPPPSGGQNGGGDNSESSSSGAQ